MTRLTKQAAQRLAEFVHLVGGEWNTPGILAALEKAAPTANAWDIAHALLRIAEDPTVKTPAMLNQPGTHWQRPDGSRIERRGDHNQACPDHPQNVHPCPDPSHRGDMTPEQIAAAAAECKRLAAEATAAARERRAHVEEARAAASDTHQRRGGGPHPAERPAAACTTPNHDDQEAS